MGMLPVVSFKAIRLKKLVGGTFLSPGTLPEGSVVSFVGAPYGGLPLGAEEVFVPRAQRALGPFHSTSP